MSVGKSGSFEGINWGKHVPHAATAIVLERALEFLLGGHGSDFSEIRSQIEDVKWGPFHRAELNIKLWKALRSDPDHSKIRENELLIEAYNCFHQSASVLKEEKRCEVLIAAASCAQYMDCAVSIHQLFIFCFCLQIQVGVQPVRPGILSDVY